MKSAHSEQYVMVTKEFGFPLYVAPLNEAGEIEVTDNKADAELWSYEDTQSAAKLPYHRSATGYTGLAFELA